MFKLNHRRTFLLHINTLACVKDIAHAKEFTLLIKFAESVSHN